MAKTKVTPKRSSSGTRAEAPKRNKQESDDEEMQEADLKMTMVSTKAVRRWVDIVTDDFLPEDNHTLAKTPYLGRFGKGQSYVHDDGSIALQTIARVSEDRDDIDVVQLKKTLMDPIDMIAAVNKKMRRL